MTNIKSVTLIASLCLVTLAACMPGDKARSQTTKSLESIPLELTTHLGDRQDFIEGDDIQFLLSLGNDAYIYMYYIDADKHITQLLPNPSQADNHYRAGYFLTIPEYENHFRFIVRAPYGSESVHVYASDADIDPKKTTSGLTPTDIDSIREAIVEASTSSFGEATLTLRTRAAVKK